jgi:hypothetical protein
LIWLTALVYAALIKLFKCYLAFRAALKGCKEGEIAKENSQKWKNDAKDSGNISKTRWTVYVAANMIPFALKRSFLASGAKCHRRERRSPF